MKMSRAALRKAIERLISKWTPLMGLTTWRIRLYWNEKDDCACQVTAAPKYETADIFFNLDYITKRCHVLEEVEDLVVHELVHCLIWKSSERAVTQVARSLMRVQDAERARRRK